MNRTSYHTITNENNQKIVRLAVNSLLSVACEQNVNFPGGIESFIDAKQLKKTQINVQSIAILDILGFKF